MSKRFFCIETTAISFVLIIVILIAGLFYYMNVNFLQIRYLILMYLMKIDI